MRIEELYNLVERYWGYKVKMKNMDLEKREVVCVLYDSFVIECGFDDYHGSFGAGIIEGVGVIIDFLGNHCSLNSDEDAIKKSLQVIDDYCRLRLPDKFLDEYDKVYS